MTIPRRTARAALHLLPSGARDRGPGRADAAHARRPRRRSEIARAFLVSPRRRWRSGWPAPSARSRTAGIPFRVPADHLLPDRLAAVLAVVYLIFNEGYARSRSTLAAEAIRLGRALAELMPDEPEVARAAGADAAARRPPRGALRDGELVLLADQDRALWDAAQIAAGRAALERALALRRPRAVRPAGGDRRRCTPSEPSSTGRRSPRSTASSPRLTGSPVVELNRAVAVAEAEGPQAGTARSSTRSTSTATSTSTRPAPSCCAGSAAATRPARPTSAPSSSPTTEPERALPRATPIRVGLVADHGGPPGANCRSAEPVIIRGWPLRISTTSRAPWTANGSSAPSTARRWSTRGSAGSSPMSRTSTSRSTFR